MPVAKLIFKSSKPNRSKLLKHENIPNIVYVADPDLCYISSSSTLGDSKTISCDNRPSSDRAKNCIVRMKKDEVFVMKATCDRGVFVMTNIILDSDKVRRCQDYQYDDVSFL